MYGAAEQKIEEMLDAESEKLKPLKKQQIMVTHLKAREIAISLEEGLVGFRNHYSPNSRFIGRVSSDVTSSAGRFITNGHNDMVRQGYVLGVFWKSLKKFAIMKKQLQICLMDIQSFT